MEPEEHRAKLAKRVASCARKLEKLPESDGVEASIKHAQDQINYWRIQQMLASHDAVYGPPNESKGNKVEARKCTEMAAEWERRKDQALGKKLLLKLEALEARIDAKEKLADKAKPIETD